LIEFRKKTLGVSIQMDFLKEGQEDGISSKKWVIV
jgi:hypothetical protein